MIPEPWPTRLRFENLDLVTRVLREAGIAHLVHAPRAATRSAVVVEASRRAEVGRALASHAALRLAAVHDTPVPPLHSPTSPAAAKLLRDADVVAAVGPREFIPGHAAEQLRYAVEVEFWSPDASGYLRPSGRSSSPAVVDNLVPDTSASMTSLGRFHDPSDPEQTTPRFPARRDLLTPSVFACELPIDAVYTWVDGYDAAWQARREAHRGRSSTWHPEVASDARYLPRDELRYSLRSLQAYAPWIRRIFIVTDDQRPTWLPHDTDRVAVVDHREVFAHPEVLPVFNSHAIESQLHRVPDLANHFLYFNDDVLLGAPAMPEEMVTSVGHTALQLARFAVPVTRFEALDNPTALAFRNVRALIERDFGRTPVTTMWHGIHPLRVDILGEMAERYEEQWRRTEASRFRGPDDLAVASAFYQYYAWCTGRAFQGTMTYAYLNLAAAQVPERLDRLRALRAAQALCINDPDARTDESVELNATVARFMADYFPLPAAHEVGP